MNLFWIRSVQLQVECLRNPGYRFPTGVCGSWVLYITDWTRSMRLWDGHTHSFHSASPVWKDGLDSLQVESCSKEALGEQGTWARRGANPFDGIGFLFQLFCLKECRKFFPCPHSKNASRMGSGVYLYIKFSLSVKWISGEVIFLGQFEKRELTVNWGLRRTVKLRSKGREGNASEVETSVFIGEMMAHVCVFFAAMLHATLLNFVKW